MIRNYLKIAARNLKKRPFYTLINIGGLAIGISCVILLLTYVNNEFSYDKFHDKADQIYKLVLERKYPTHSSFYHPVPYSFAEVIPNDFEEVELAARLAGPFTNFTVEYNDGVNLPTINEETNFMVADSAFFDMFSIKLLKGDRRTVLRNPNDLIVTEQTAERYFGSDDPIGKTITAGFLGEMKIVGVCENVPSNSHFNFDFLGSWWAQPFVKEVNFISFYAQTYLRVNRQADPKALERQFPDMVNRYAAGQLENAIGKSWEEYVREGNGYNYSLLPLTSVHLDPTNYLGKMKPGGNIVYARYLIVIAFAILLIAIINFVTLYTSRSQERGKEIGVRKTLGSEKSNLILQFYTETAIVVMLASILAIILTSLFFGDFTNLANTVYELPLVTIFTLSLGIFLPAIVIVAGAYPALVLSNFKPILVLKGQVSGSKSGVWVRKCLVVFQFTSTVVLIVCALVVNDQIDYFQKRPLGFNKEQVVIIKRANLLLDNQEYFIESLKKISGVESAAFSGALFGRQREFFGSPYQVQGQDEMVAIRYMHMDDEFEEAMNLEVINGRGFSKEDKDSLYVLLNASAVKALNLTDPIGKRITEMDRNDPTKNFVFTIKGVLNDFNFESLHNEVGPLLVKSTESADSRVNYAYVKLNGNNVPETISEITSNWSSINNEIPMEYDFLDSNLKVYYESEVRTRNIFGVFAFLTILIAAVGLLGLVSYDVNRRFKEIGVRKVFGASVTSIVRTLLFDFSKLLLVAILVAVPFSYLMMDTWLQQFPYRIDIDASQFILAGLFTVIFSLITLGYHTVNAARSNPIKAIRNQ